MTDDDYEDLDDLRREELPEMPAAVAGVLDDWVFRRFGRISGHHGVGLFLDLLAAEGYRVHAIEVPSLDSLLGPAAQ